MQNVEVVDGSVQLVETTVPDSVILFPENDDLTHFVGDTSGFSINDTSPVLLNNLSLKQTTLGTQDDVSIGSDSGLQNYPQAGQTVSGYVYTTSGQAAPQFHWGVQTPSDLTSSGTHYSWFLDSRSGSQRIVMRDDLASQDNTSLSLSADTWYEVELDWGSDGQMTVTVYDIDQSDASRNSSLGSVSYTDSAQTSGGVGFSDGAGEALPRFDFFDITAGF